jgi:regulator of protease activity HflC (stomatin/prohibitin superfamily)
MAAEQEQLSERPASLHRVVRANGELLTKLPSGAEAQAQRLRADGIAIDNSRKVPRVVDLALIECDRRLPRHNSMQCRAPMPIVAQADEAALHAMCTKPTRNYT